jgi:hypothetical protein
MSHQRENSAISAAPAAEADAHAARQAAREAARKWSPPRLSPPEPAEYNRLNLDYRAPIPRPPVAPPVIDCHTHLIAWRHAAGWFEAADHYGIDHVISMTPLEEALRLLRGPWAHRLTLIAVPAWQQGAYDAENFWRRVAGYRNLGCRVVKFHLAPQTLAKSGLGLVIGTPEFEKTRRYVHMAAERGMIVMTHVGDPQSWYDSHARYGGDVEFYGSREQHYEAWRLLLEETRGHPWWGAHLGGNPEDLGRLTQLLEDFPDLMLDLSATKWMVREISRQRDAAREFVVRYQDRLMWGSDQVSFDGRGFDFLASRWWCHRKLWETAHIGQSPIADQDVAGGPPMLRGLALPGGVLQKLYSQNIVRLMARVGVKIPHARATAA